MKSYFIKYRKIYTLICVIAGDVALLALPLFLGVRNERLFQQFPEGTQVPLFHQSALFYNSEYLPWIKLTMTLKKTAYYYIGFFWALAIVLLSVPTIFLFLHNKNICCFFSITSIAWLAFSIYCPMLIFWGRNTHLLIPNIGFLIILASSIFLFLLNPPKIKQRISKKQQNLDLQRRLENLEKEMATVKKDEQGK